MTKQEKLEKEYEATKNRIVELNNKIQNEKLKITHAQQEQTNAKDVISAATQDIETAKKEIDLAEQDIEDSKKSQTKYDSLVQKINAGTVTEAELAEVGITFKTAETDYLDRAEERKQAVLKLQDEADDCKDQIKFKKDLQEKAKTQQKEAENKKKDAEAKLASAEKTIKQATENQKTYQKELDALNKKTLKANRQGSKTFVKVGATLLAVIAVAGAGHHIGKAIANNARANQPDDTTTDDYDTTMGDETVIETDEVTAAIDDATRIAALAQAVINSNTAYFTDNGYSQVDAENIILLLNNYKPSTSKYGHNARITNSFELEDWFNENTNHTIDALIDGKNERFAYSSLYDSETNEYKVLSWIETNYQNVVAGKLDATSFFTTIAQIYYRNDTILGTNRDTLANTDYAFEGPLYYTIFDTIQAYSFTHSEEVFIPYVNIIKGYEGNAGTNLEGLVKKEMETSRHDWAINMNQASYNECLTLGLGE